MESLKFSFIKNVWISVKMKLLTRISYCFGPSELDVLKFYFVTLLKNWNFYSGSSSQTTTGVDLCVVLWMPWFHRQATLIQDSKHLEPTAVCAPAPKHPQVYANSNPYSQPTNEPHWFSLGARPEIEAFGFSPFTQLKKENKYRGERGKYALKENSYLDFHILPTLGALTDKDLKSAIYIDFVFTLIATDLQGWHQGSIYKSICYG